MAHTPPPAVPQFGMHQAKTKLSQLVKRADSGEETVIARNGKPIVRPEPLPSASSLAAVRGAWRGRVEISDDFDELLDDIAEALGAG